LRLGILGVGLIGGSIGLAARARAQAHVSGYDPDPLVCDAALELGAIDARSQDLAGAVHGADVVFVAAPVGALEATVREALAHAGPECLVTDVGSTKRLLAGLESDGRFVGGHPLAGAETAGVAHAREDLFDGATWYLTPAAGTTGLLYERLHRLLRTLGALPTAIDPESHDRLMARVSHLPHVLANLLVTQAAGMLGETDRERLPAIGPSFRDATRVAGANSAIWTDIYISNRDALIEGIDELLAGLHDVRAALAAGDARAVRSWNDRSRSDREALFGSSLSGGPVHELRVSVPNRPGVVAEIALALGRAGVNIADLALSPSQDNRQGVVSLWIAGDGPSARAEQLVSELGHPVARA
jgi:prephenate dehydrogenase